MSEHHASRAKRRSGTASCLLAAGALLLLTACGGGGGSGSTPTSTSQGDGWAAGVFQSSANFAARCVDPRVGTDPATGRAFPDRQGTRLDENNWLRSWTRELYLWYREVVDRNPSLYATAEYFELLKTDALTASGRPKDNFHFSMPTEEWQQFAESGVGAGYGILWTLPAATPPRDIRVGFVEPGSPAASSTTAVERGWRVLSIDGVDAVGATSGSQIDLLNAALFPSEPGVSRAFLFENPATGARHPVTLTSAIVTSAPVHAVQTIDTGSGSVGYMLFNDHIATAEAALIDAVRALDDAGIDDLVLDLRYNSGGYIDIASELSYMIAGAGRTDGRTFELFRFNDQHTQRNPVTGELLAPLPFLDAATGLSATEGLPLPSLDLTRVFVLTGAETCSASESIINGLRGVDLQVIQIGATTCGKPYGFYPTDNCGTTYFSVQFQGVNDKGFGDYPNGFSPANTPGLPGVPVDGCAVADDFARALGDPAEVLFAAALSRRATGTCPAPSASAGAESALRSQAVQARAALQQPAWRSARLRGGAAVAPH